MSLSTSSESLPLLGPFTLLSNWGGFWSHSCISFKRFYNCPPAESTKRVIMAFLRFSYLPVAGGSWIISSGAKKVSESRALSR